MKSIIRNFALTTALFAFVSSAVFAQEKVTRDTFKKHKKNLEFKKNTLTDAQKKIMTERMELMKKNKAELEATFNAKQKEILSNNSLSRVAKKEALETTYSAKQKKLVEQHKKQLSTIEDKFKNSLSAEQKEKIEQRKKSFDTSRAFRNTKNDSLKSITKNGKAGIRVKKEEMPHLKNGLKARKLDSKPDDRGKGEFLKNATEEQKALLNTNKQLRIEHRKALEATFSDNQKEILADKAVDFKIKKQKLEASYTNEQKKLIEKHQQENKIAHEKLMKTLTNEQKETLKQVKPTLK